MEISLSEDQNKAFEALLEWAKRPSAYLTMGGYAGTGKTTLISLFRRQLNKEFPKKRVSFCSFTGKAARVLQDKLIENKAIFKNDTVGTIHSLIYSPSVNLKGEIVGWERKDKVDCDLIIVDEASMVDQTIWKDLYDFKIPIIAVGDHGQLPPIRGNFNLMDSPSIRLERIHRQAEGNPIIQLSLQARKEGKIPVGVYSDKVRKLDRSDPETREVIGEELEFYSDEKLVLCGYNNTRNKLNQHIRGFMEFETDEPTVGDRVICLKNNHEKKIFNGMLGDIVMIEEYDSNWYYAEIDMIGNYEQFEGLISKDQFGSSGALNHTEDRKKYLKGDLFDFGYALTVHKAQGSQAKSVLLFEERFKQMDDQMWAKWLYTAVTRAEEELTILGS